MFYEATAGERGASGCRTPGGLAAGEIRVDINVENIGKFLLRIHVHKAGETVQVSAKPLQLDEGGFVGHTEFPT